MLKKLLASALAVATVASCAYVPTALASAATTYKTADVVTYQDWKLKNPDAPATATKDTVTVYVSNGTTSRTLTGKVEPENNNQEYIQANLDKVLGLTGADAIVTTDAKAAVKAEVAYVGKAGTNVYFAQVTFKKAVLFRTYKPATNVATIDTAATTWEKDVQVLGYYDCNAAGTITDAGKSAAFQEANKYTSEAKIGGATVAQEFAGWQYFPGDATTADVIASVFVNRADAFASNDEKVYVKTVVGTPTAYELETGLYTSTTYTEVVVPKNADATTKALMIKNYLKANAGWYDLAPSVTANGVTTTYSAYDLRLVDATNKYYGITFRANAPTGAANKAVEYEVQFWDKNDSGSTQVATMKGKYYSANYYYTHDVEEIYTMLKASTDTDKYMQSHVGAVVASSFNKDTLADYLAQNKTATTTVPVGTEAYVLTSEKTLDTESTGANGEYKVVIHAIVDKVTKYEVYSYAADNAVVKSDAWLTDDQAKVTSGKIAATAKELGVATSASIDNVPAEYAYAAPASTGSKIIYTTYKLGDAIGVELKDFQTAEGEFKSEPYFGRDAKVGDQVTLKVSLSETGVAKKLDLSKLDVKYAVSGNATVAKENYDYAATEYPAGEAIDIALGEGTNIVVATVYYNGVKVGTFEPFYAYVG